MKYPGTITIEFMEPIRYEDIKRMKNGEILDTVENLIENRCNILNKKDK